MQVKVLISHLNDCLWLQLLKVHAAKPDL